MTRSEAIATITRHLEAADDTTLQAVAANLQGRGLATMTIGEAVAAFAAESTLPRALTAAELALVEQAKDDFRHGRTRTLAESRAYVDAELERRRNQRSGA